MTRPDNGPGVLLRTVSTTPTEIWNDSCVAAELQHAIANGATGATSNPSLVLDVLRQEPGHWADRVRALSAALTTATEADLAWRIAEEIAITGAQLLEPVFARTSGRQASSRSRRRRHGGSPSTPRSTSRWQAPSRLPRPSSEGWRAGPPAAMT